MNSDSGDEEDDQRQSHQKNHRKQQLLSPSQTASTSISAITNDCTRPLNPVENREQIIKMDKQHTHHDVDRKMTNNWDKFRLLMWKNGMLQWRHKVQTLFEILIPVGFSAILILIRSIVDPDVFPEPTYYKPFEINTLQPLQ